MNEILHIPISDNIQYCVYHKNCFDGICSAWVVKRRYPNVELIPMGYSDPYPAILSTARSILFVDFCPKREVLDLFISYGVEVFVIDHHKTAEADCKDLPYVYFDMAESGASLAWKTLFPNETMPWLVRYIKDRDLWELKLWETEAINSYIQSFPMDINIYENLYSELQNDKDRQRIAMSGQSILRYKSTMVEAMCKNAAGTAGWPFYNDSVPIVNTSMLFFEVGNELCKLYPKAPFAAYYFDRLSDGIRQWGLRSIGDFDVSEVAKALGGGGHRNAAGFEHPLNMRLLNRKGE